MTQPPDVAHVPASLLPRLARLKPYTLVVYRKGPAYDEAQAPRVIQAEHLPYLFELRDSGEVLLSAPAFGHASYAAIALYRGTDRAAVVRLLAGDPAIRAGVFVADVVGVLGMPGDALA